MSPDNQSVAQPAPLPGGTARKQSFRQSGPSSNLPDRALLPHFRIFHSSENKTNCQEKNFRKNWNCPRQRTATLKPQVWLRAPPEGTASGRAMRLADRPCGVTVGRIRVTSIPRSSRECAGRLGHGVATPRESKSCLVLPGSPANAGKRRFVPT